LSTGFTQVLRAKDQIWFSVPTGTSTRNDTILVFDISQGIWSRYDLHADVLIEVEDAAGTPFLYGGVQGRLVRLEDGQYDGATVTGIIADSGTTASLTDTSASWTVDAYKGLYLDLYFPAEGTVERVEI